MKVMNPLRGITLACAVLVSSARAAISPVIDGNTWTFTVASGVTETYSTALPGAVDVVKDGAGRLVLDTASTAFDGTVVVRGGTLEIKDAGALGATSVPISVEDGGRLLLSLPGGAQFGHVITIAGTGADSAAPYAFDYNRTSTGNSDSLIDGLVLADDATIVVRNGQRWGVATGGTIELNGHTLTRKGSGSWMIKNIDVKSTGGAGTVVNTAGTLTFQGTPQVSSDVTFDIASGSGVVGLWAVEKSADIAGTVSLAANRTLQAQSGNNAGDNRLGCVNIGGTGVTLATTCQSGARSMSIDRLTGAADATTAVTGLGSLYLKDAALSTSGNFAAQCKDLHLIGDGASRDLNLRITATNTTTIAGGNTFLRSLRVASGGATSGQLRHTGGVTGVQSGDPPRIGEASGQRAYFTMEGGEFHASNTVFVAEKKGSFGAFRQTGGYFESWGPPTGNTQYTVFLHIGRGGDALFVQTGGTNDIAHAVSTGSQSYRAMMGSTNGTVAATIAGAGTEFRTSGFQMGGSGISTNILNLANGGTLKANRFRSHNSRPAGSLTVVNVDGGIFAPTYAGDVTAAASGTNPDKFVIWGGGMVVDTSDNSMHSGTGITALPFDFSAPSGKGVEGIALPSSVPGTYIGVGQVVIEDATGWGASAYAEFDFATKKLTGIIVTSRGCDYSDGAKAYLVSPDGKSRTECELTLSANDGPCGAIVKRGGPQLILSGEAGSFSGGYAVEEGGLQLRTAVASADALRVEADATLDLYQNAISAATFEGAGSVVNGDVTVTGALRVKCADVFAGRHAAFGGALAFGENAILEIADPENLAGYKESARAAAVSAAGGISGAPALRLAGCGDAGNWKLEPAANGMSLMLSFPKAFVLVLR